MFKYIKSRGFTDRLYIINFAFVICITIASYILNLVSGILQIVDTSLFSTTVIAAWTELGLHTALVVSKAKKENSKKIAIGMIKEFANEYGIENIGPIIQVVVED